MTVNNPELVEWLPASAKPPLPPDEVHCWRASLNCNDVILSKLEATLSSDEKSRAGRYVFDSDRKHFIVARGILRQLLGAYMNLPPAQLRFCYGPQGKPELDPEHFQSAPRFNLSHSHGLALYAFSHGRELGIDIEKVAPDFAGDDIAKKFFSATELAELRNLPPEQRDEGFFLCWTRKEAYIKARVGGLQIPLHSFTVSLAPGKPESLQSIDSSRWTLRGLQPMPEYAAAIVAEGKGWQLRCWDGATKTPD